MSALVLADVGQRPDAGDVADRPQPLADAQLRVDRDAVRVGLDADGLEPDAVDARAPAGRDQQAVAAQLAPVVERQDVVVAFAPRGGRLDAEDDLDAVAAQRVGERLAERRGLAGEQVLGPVARASPRRRDGATACAISTPTGPPPSTSSRRGTAFRPVASRLVQSPSSSRRPGIGGMNGSAPVATTTCSRGVAYAVDLDDARPGESAAAAQQGDPATGQPALLAGVGVVGDHEVAPGERRGDIDLGASAAARRARRATASPGRSSVLDGMQAQ